MQTLHLSSNHLGGTLDPAWHLPDGLRDFDVSHNKLSGLLPAWNLPNLERANFTFCNFTGKTDPTPVTTVTTPRRVRLGCVVCAAELWVSSMHRALAATIVGPLIIRTPRHGIPPRKGTPLLCHGSRVGTREVADFSAFPGGGKWYPACRGRDPPI